ncbi:alpha-amylase AmyA [Histoplasma capsulatum]|uniref:Alpha-amylase n=1 Tax=Ajellomyces capsulatus TaxID=5037 RepID=A0A8A1MCH2_AJECA|nr:alpha-amylase AmyA [Histoplasma capsulatum]
MISALQFPCRLLGLLILCRLAALSLAASTEDWRFRSIYQVFTDRFARSDGSTTAECDPRKGLICGGTWRGIINKMDYIQDLGFDAIMISPVTMNIEGLSKYGEAYHGYWVQDLYQLNPHFGTRQDLLDLARELHSRGMYLMVDIVINNMAVILDGKPFTSIDYTMFNPFNDPKYYHPYCKIEDYSNYTQARNCWMGDDVVALPDLNTESEEVNEMMESWVKDLVANYSIDGLRIDAAKHVGPEYLKRVAKASGVFATGEVYEGDVAKVCDFQNLLPSVPNYPLYFSMIETFTAGKTKVYSEKLSLEKATCNDITTLATFTENHDLPRFASYTKDISLAQNAIVFTLLSDGIPLYYQGQEQHFSGGDTPENREALWTSNYNTDAPLYKLTTTLNKIRAHVISVNAEYVINKSYITYSDGSALVTRKGVEGSHLTVVYSNQGEHGGPYRIDLRSSYAPGMIVTEVLGCTNYTVDPTGTLAVPMDAGLPKVIFPAEKMPGSGLCGTPDWIAHNNTLNSGSSSLRHGTLGLAGVPMGIILTSLTASFIGLL